MSAVPDLGAPPHHPTAASPSRNRAAAACHGGCHGIGDVLVMGLRLNRKHHVDGCRTMARRRSGLPAHPIRAPTRLRGPPSESIRLLVERICGPNVSAEDVEGFFDDITSGLKRVGSAVAPTSARAAGCRLRRRHRERAGAVRRAGWRPARWSDQWNSGGPAAPGPTAGGRARPRATPHHAQQPCGHSVPARDADGPGRPEAPVGAVANLLGTLANRAAEAFEPDVAPGSLPSLLEGRSLD